MQNTIVVPGKQLLEQRFLTYDATAIFDPEGWTTVWAQGEIMILVLFCPWSEWRAKKKFLFFAPTGVETIFLHNLSNLSVSKLSAWWLVTWVYNIDNLEYCIMGVTNLNFYHMSIQLGTLKNNANTPFSCLCKCLNVAATRLLSRTSKNLEKKRSLLLATLGVRLWEKHCIARSCFTSHKKWGRVRTCGNN